MEDKPVYEWKAYTMTISFPTDQAEVIREQVRKSREAELERIRRGIDWSLFDTPTFHRYEQDEITGQWGWREL